MRPVRMPALVAGLALAAALPAMAQPVSYHREVRPILERNCLACHACYDAPCQLKMEDAAGLDRGASQEAVYAAARLKDQEPSRLHFDEPDTAAWRRRGFESVLEGGEASLLAKMLELGRHNTMRPDAPIPEDIVTGLHRKTECARASSFEDYAAKHPQEGMPLAVAPLSDPEYTTLQAWLRQGASMDDDPGVPPLSATEASLVEAWEDFLNGESLREKLMGRYLYEHLYLGHLLLEGEASRRPFQLVRSSTPPGSPPAPVSAVRPNYPPRGEFWYRLRPVSGTIVHKTHITYPLGPEKLDRYRELFLDPDWDVDALPEYRRDASANPFETFRAIPAESRYRFMLDDALFFVRTFIRGPVCRGQIATDVIEDHFYALFQTPETDRFLHDPEYAERQLPNLYLPGREGWALDVRPPWLRAEMRYHKARDEAYEDAPGFGWDHLWTGNQDALLTVFRHHDSATVERGLVGEVPENTWVMDYPLFERIYYLLVVNFNVFGRAQHQVSTRLYFDTLRAEAEVNYLRFLPAKVRKPLRKSWYRGWGAGIKRMLMYPAVSTDAETTIDFHREDPRKTFTRELLSRAAHLAPRADHLNRCDAKPCVDRGVSAAQQRVEGELQRLTNLSGSRAPFLLELPELTWIRVTAGGEGEDYAYALTRDREHQSVAFMMGEESRLEPQRDRLTLVRGPLGSYPNFMFAVPREEVHTFVDGLLRVRGKETFLHMVEAFGVRRMHPEFWDHFHFFTDWMKEHDPLEAGVYDANRYANF